MQKTGRRGLPAETRRATHDLSICECHCCLTANLHDTHGERDSLLNEVARRLH